MKLLWQPECQYDNRQQILDPRHYLVTLARRPAALDHSNVYRNWQLPAALGELRTLLEQRHGPHAGSRQYIRVLQLLATHPLARVRRVVEHCSRKGLLNAEVICQQTERLALRDAVQIRPFGSAHVEPPELPVNNPNIHVQVPRPDLRQFNQLLIDLRIANAIRHRRIAR